MKTTLFLLATVAGALAAPVHAADRTPLPAEAALSHAVAVQSFAADARARTRIAKPGPAAPKVTGSQTLPGTPMANPFRAYPPSCAADPLPDAWTGTTPKWSGSVKLYAVSGTGGYPAEETVTITVWRLACSSSGDATPYNPDGYSNAMTLMRIDRAAAYEGDVTYIPTFPLLRVSQNGSPLTGAASLVRAAQEPNTVVSEITFGSLVIDSTTFVLENYPYQNYGYFTFSDAFTLQVDPAYTGGTTLELNIPAYNPTQGTYPDAFSPREIDGYAAAQYTNSELGEGLLLQVTEQYDGSGRLVRQVIFDLLSLDLDGYPMWLVGSAAFEVGAKSLTFDLAYLDIDNVTRPWGTATIQLPDCNHVSVDFEARTDLPDPILGFSGVTEYTRIFAPNGLVCE